MSETKLAIECCICGMTDKWQNVDQYRMKPDGMCICMNCGFCTYPEVIAKSEDLKEFYRKEYREPPTVAAVFTGQRKLHYHNAFLEPLMNEWKKEKFNPKVLEIGAAFGMFLKWFRDNFKNGEFYGTELTLAHRRIAEYHYNIVLDEDFDASKKYDLIASYKVAEHVPFIDKELRKYAECLSDKGFLYISVPVWFKYMTNFGTGGFSLDYYYHKNHINVWTQKLFETLLKKCGLEVVKENHYFYDSTYLCKRNDELMKGELPFEDPIQVLDKLDRIKKASLAFDSGQLEEAITIWPFFPDGWVNFYEMKRAEFHKKGFEVIEKEVLQKAMAACPDNFATVIFCVDVCMRYSKWDKAMQLANEGLRIKPNDPGALTAIAMCFRQMGDLTSNPEERAKCYSEAMEATKYLSQTSFEHAHSALTWIFADIAKIPMKSEIAKGAPVMKADNLDPEAASKAV